MIGNSVTGGKIIHAYINQNSGSTPPPTARTKVRIVPDGISAAFSDAALVGKTDVDVYWEGFYSYSGTGSDEYNFNSATGTITFNTVPGANNRIDVIAF